MLSRDTSDFLGTTQQPVAKRLDDADAEKNENAGRFMSKVANSEARQEEPAYSEATEIENSSTYNTTEERNYSTGGEQVSHCTVHSGSLCGWELMQKLTDYKEMRL
jgi:hypothetical protein